MLKKDLYEHILFYKSFSQSSCSEFPLEQTKDISRRKALLLNFNFKCAHKITSFFGFAFAPQSRNNLPDLQYLSAH